MKNQNRKLDMSEELFELVFKDMYHKGEEELYRKDFEHFQKTGEVPPVEFQKRRTVTDFNFVKDKENKK